MFKKIAFGICLCLFSTSTIAGVDSTAFDPGSMGLVYDSGGGMQCITKTVTSGPMNGHILYCDAGYTVTGGGCVFTNSSHNTSYYSYPLENGWYCRNSNTSVKLQSVRCCK